MGDFAERSHTWNVRGISSAISLYFLTFLSFQTGNNTGHKILYPAVHEHGTPKEWILALFSQPLPSTQARSAFWLFLLACLFVTFSIVVCISISFQTALGTLVPVLLMVKNLLCSYPRLFSLRTRSTALTGEGVSLLSFPPRRCTVPSDVIFLQRSFVRDLCLSLCIDCFGDYRLKQTNIAPQECYASWFLLFFHFVHGMFYSSWSTLVDIRPHHLSHVDDIMASWLLLTSHLPPLFWTSGCEKCK